MASDFIGNNEVRHVEQLPDSNGSFAAIVSSVTDATMFESHRALRENRPPRGRLSEADGTTRLMGFPAELKVAGSVVTFEPLEAAEDPQKVMGLMDGQFEDGKAVALLHKANGNGHEGPDYDWVLLTGYRARDGEKGSIHIINPRYENAGYMGRHAVAEMIERSMDPAKGGRGVYPYAISVRPERPPGQLAAAAQSAKQALVEFFK